MRYIDVTCARNFLRLRVNAERVFPIPPMIINNPPIIRTDHLRIRTVFCFESIVVIDVTVDIDNEDIFDADDDNDAIWLPYVVSIIVVLLLMKSGSSQNTSSS